METKIYNIFWQNKFIAEIEATNEDAVYEKIVSDLIIKEIREE